MKTIEHSEMAIPKWSSEVIFSIVIFLILLLGTVLALLNLLFLWDGVGVIVSCLWLAIMACCIWIACKDEGGIRKLFINYLGLFARKQFVECVPRDAGGMEIRFGFRLFGRRLYYQRMPLDKIESVKWTPYYSPNWFVSLWFDHDDPEESQRRRKLKNLKPDQNIYVVGPSRSKAKTVHFGHAFVAFLRRAGATLEPGENDCIFVRTTSGSMKNDVHSTGQGIG